MTAQNSLRPMNKSEALAGAWVISRAFAKDPFTLHMLPYNGEDGRGPDLHIMDLNYGLK